MPGAPPTLRHGARYVHVCRRPGESEAQLLVALGVDRHNRVSSVAGRHGSQLPVGQLAWLRVDGPEAIPHLEDVSEGNDNDLHGCTAGYAGVNTLARMLGGTDAIIGQDSTHRQNAADDDADDAACLYFCVFIPAHVCAIVIQIAWLVLQSLVAL